MSEFVVNHALSRGVAILSSSRLAVQYLTGGFLMLAIALSAAVPVAAVGVDDTVRHVFVTNTESLSSPAMRLDVESQAIKDKFLADATPIRRALAGKRAALQAVYRARTGDTAAAARLGEEIFDLREQLRLKAQAIGLLPALLMDGEESECAGESRR